MFKPESAQASGNLRFAQDSATLIHLCEQANTCAAIIDLSGRYLAKTSDCSQRFGQQQTAAHIGETHLADILAGAAQGTGVRLICQSGDTNLELRSEPLTGLDGQRSAVALFWLNPDNAHNQDAANRSTEALYRSLLQQSSDAIFLFDPHTLRLREANQRFRQLLGLNVADEQQLTLLDLIVAPMESVRQNVQRVLNEGHVHIGERRYQRSDGSSIEVDVVASLVNINDHPYCVVNLRDLSQQRAHEKAVQKLAQQDQLTGLPNRVLLLDRLRQAIAVAKRYDRQVALMSLNLDRFKQINNSLGHNVGDALLQQVAGRLALGVRSSDTVSRLGGDEFVILLPEISSTRDVAMIADKMISHIAHPYLIDEQELVISPSVGICLFPDDGEEPDKLLRNADAALFNAKESGGRCYKFFTPEMNTRAAERLALESRLRRAIEKGEFQLHYQPQIDLQSGKIIGCEALIRWQHPELGMVPPLKFIPVAEESKLILPIGDWVLHEACRQNRAWQQQGLPSVVVAVNLSALQFHQKNLQPSIARALQQTGLEPQYLELEVTESAIMSDAEDVLGTMKQLRDMGLELAIDDFGTGYSSLSYLKRFPVGKLKIDRSFIRDIHEDPDDAAISTAIISLARNLNLRTVAEGIETAPQLAFLRDHGCDQGQGYLFGKPLPAAQFAELLAAQTHGAAIPPEA
ncbi:MAG: putative bifunctional diguanylate cyclase/phosphodiesterase [Burkholderiales bacterium]|jgi:diguanylate cyclase (GGDEF)-like protein/PAS domain S-box-containing protein